jgi:putative membrane protein
MVNCVKDSHQIEPHKYKLLMQAVFMSHKETCGLSYLEDPRVFYAIERTLLAWMRTEIAILAFAFLLKKFGFDLAEKKNIHDYMDYALYFLCGMVVVMSVLSLIQCYFSISKLGESELPTKSSKFVVLFTGLVGIILCAISSMIVFAI